ncbi:hypothetical protein MRB53_037363 [Persea americana]|nr:hypothetical protein MRB53_037363 [Persea americana]
MLRTWTTRSPTAAHEHLIKAGLANGWPMPPAVQRAKKVNRATPDMIDSSNVPSPTASEFPRGTNVKQRIRETGVCDPLGAYAVTSADASSYLDQEDRALVYSVVQGLHGLCTQLYGSANGQSADGSVIRDRLVGG